MVINLALVGCGKEIHQIPADAREGSGGSDGSEGAGVGGAGPGAGGTPGAGAGGAAATGGADGATGGAGAGIGGTGGALTDDGGTDAPADTLIHGLSFAPAANYSTVDSPTAVRIGEVSGDNRSDLVVATLRDYGVIRRLVNRGDGTFFPVAALLITTTDPTAIALGDLNGDGATDIVGVARSTPGDISLLLQTGGAPDGGAGGFGAARRFIVGHDPLAVDLADVNSDGHTDVVIAEGDGAHVGVLLGTGDDLIPVIDVPAGCSPNSFGLAARDITGDDKVDIVVSCYPSVVGDAAVGLAGIYLLRGLGGGGFSGPQLLAQTDAVRGMELGDLNGDGFTDIATAQTPLTAGVALGVAYGRGGALVGYVSGGQPTSVAIGDLNGDQYPDLAVTNFDDGTVSVLLNAGNGIFGPPTAFAVETRPSSVAIGDLNGDGRLDLAVGNAGSRSVSVLINTSR